MSRYKQPFALYKRGRYWYYRTYTPSGVRTAGISTGCTSKNAAMDFCNELYKSNRLYEDRQNFGEFAAHFFDEGSLWLKDRTEPLSVCTLKMYRSNLNNYLLPDIGEKLLSQINYSFISNYRLELLKKLKPASVNSIMAVFKIILMVAARDELIRKNPFDDIKRLTVKTARRDGFSLDEVKKVYCGVVDKFKPLVMLQAVCGLRISEARAISISKIKELPEGFFLEVNSQIVLSYGLIKNTKTKTDRLVPVPAAALNLIKSIGPISYTEYSVAIKKISSEFESAESRSLSSHSLRHFFITAAKSSGVLSQKVEQAAGHSLKGIEEVYTQFKPSDFADLQAWQEKTLDFILS